MKGLAWSYDESNAYMVTYDDSDGPAWSYEYLVVFNAPYAAEAKPYVYRTELKSGSFVSTN